MEDFVNLEGGIFGNWEKEALLEHTRFVQVWL